MTLFSLIFYGFLEENPRENIGTARGLRMPRGRPMVGEGLRGREREHKGLLPLGAE
jgi:hypothetical protein